MPSVSQQVSLQAIPHVSIIIITYNSTKDISACLQSILDQQSVAVELIIIDNHSSDMTSKVITDFFMQLPKPINSTNFPNTTMIQNQENLGFSKAVNQAAKLARGEFIYLFNPDAKFSTPTDMANLIAYAQKNSKLGLVGSKVVGLDGVESKPQYSYPNERFVSFDSSELPGKLAWVIGASMLILTKVFIEIGGLEEDSFLYIEDIDLCLRLRQKDLEIGYCPEVVVQHIGSASADQLPSYDKKVLKTKARYLFCKK